MKVLRVERQEVRGSRSLWIERAQPPCRCERLGPEENRRMVHAGEYSEPLSYTTVSDGNFRVACLPTTLLEVPRTRWPALDVW
jgi:hypothetical protein